MNGGEAEWRITDHCWRTFKQTGPCVFVMPPANFVEILFFDGSQIKSVSVKTILAATLPTLHFIK